MRFSDFGSRFTGGTGTGSLMNDLSRLPTLPAGHAGVCRLGGGNPARIPAAEQRYQQALAALAHDADRFSRALGSYASPQGDPAFIEALCEMMGARHGLDLAPHNVLLTNGSQNGFVQLFNLFGGSVEHENLRHKILLPLAPEYIGYGDLALGEEIFISRQPDIEILSSQRFKYRLQVDGLQHLTLEDGEQLAAICVSRPSNPTGNVLTDSELAALAALAEARDVPLIIDNAYGAPFPDIIHVPATFPRSENVILSMSLSKVGLPGARTGILVAHESIIAALTEMNAVMNLAPGGIAPAMMAPLIQNGELEALCTTHIRPWYAQRARRALEQFDAEFSDLPVRAHVYEGSIFLWLWFEDLPITSHELYQGLYRDGVVVVSGHHFFPGLEDNPQQPWKHRHECLRVSFAGDEAEVSRGLAMIAKHARQAYALAA